MLEKIITFLIHFYNKGRFHNGKQDSILLLQIKKNIKLLIHENWSTFPLVPSSKLMQQDRMN